MKSYVANLTAALLVVGLLAVPMIGFGADPHHPPHHSHSELGAHPHHHQCGPECEFERQSPEWYAQEAQRPIGARQWFKKGKFWPPWPRPTGKPAQWSHRYHAAHYWPYPYICDDRAYVRTVLEQQTANGWTSATTLYHYHFDPETGEMNQSGRLHLRWILENAPSNRRVAFVQTGTTGDESQFRAAQVRMEAARMVGEEGVPPIMLRVTSPVGRPAEEVDRIRRLELESLPAPRIEYGADAGGSASGN